MCQCDGTSREEKFDSRYHPDGTGRRGRPKKKAVVVPAPAPVPALAMKVAVRNSAKKARKRIRGYGWIGQACEFLCNRQNHARRDRRGLFSIHTKYGLLNRRPKKVSFCEAEVPEDEPSTHVGMEVRKYFDRVGECTGAVVGHDIDEDTGLILFIVKYDDKEQEDYNWSELRPLLLCDNSSSPKPGSDRDSDSENDGLPIAALCDNSTSHKPGSGHDS
jgi:hypothetical protein